MKNNRRLYPLLALVFLVVGGCSDGTGDDGGSGGSTGGGSGTGGTGGGGGTGEPAPYSSVAWLPDIIQVDDPTLPAGVQGKLLRGNDGTLYYGYFKFANSDPTCDIAVFGGGVAPGVNYTMKVAVKAAGETTWTIEEVPLSNSPGGDDDYVNSLFGIDGLVEDGGDGDAVFVVAAGEPGLTSCGSSDLILVRRTGDDTYAFERPADASAQCCSLYDCDGDPACNNGTDVGAWAAIAESPSGDLLVGYTDYHNFWDQDGQTMQGYEMWDEANGIAGIRPWSGLGIYSAMIYAGDYPITAFAGYNATGLWVLRYEGSAGTKDDWVEVMTVDNVEVGERISLAVAADGTVGLAYHERVNTYGNIVHDLRYCESADDGATWSACETVGDEVRQEGYYPSLAFDNENRPVIAYRFCGTDSCENAYDGAKLVWREHSGEWGSDIIHNEGTSKSGLYAALALDAVTNEPTVVFQNQTTGGAMVFYGSFP